MIHEANDGLFLVLEMHLSIFIFSQLSDMKQKSLGRNLSTDIK